MKRKVEVRGSMKKCEEVMEESQGSKVPRVQTSKGPKVHRVPKTKISQSHIQM